MMFHAIIYLRIFLINLPKPLKQNHFMKVLKYLLRLLSHLFRSMACHLTPEEDTITFQVIKHE